MVLLLVPATALGRLVHSIDGRVLAGVPVAVSVVVFLLYRLDKLRAGAGEWRVPEWVLHLGESAAGWPGAFVAQRVYRHKSAKISYQMIFWLIVLLHQFVALDFLLGWKFLGAAREILS
jgi:uncharacterized membrane protein YsdA (DUF1294 family)